MAVDFKKVVEELDNCELLQEIIDSAADNDVRAPGQRAQAKVASQIYVGRILHTSIASLVAALGESASAANRHAKNLTIATVALVVATLGLVAAALIPGLMA